MAYGIKYRLEFSDENLKGKKVEILKDGYSGSVLSLTGAEEPVVITWDSNDNIYSPIKGSTCTINLFDTSSSAYDNFYEADEREYQVKIYYKDSSSNYQIFWIGWLVVDQFKEALQAKPYPISLTAYDGLGLLGGYDMPTGTSYTAKSFLYYIYTILDDLDLDLDIYISNDILQSSPSASTYTLYDQILVSQRSYFKDGWDLRTSKKVLETILKYTNARIFQSYGRWYIINNSSYSEQSVKNSSYTTASGGSVPTGIRASETASLVANGTESIKYIIYNYLGVYQSTSTVDVLQKIPTNLLPLDADLTREYLRPLKSHTIETDLGQSKPLLNVNPGFEFGTTAWTAYSSSTATESPGEISTAEVLQGNKSWKNSQVQTSTSLRDTLKQVTDLPQTQLLKYKLELNAFLESDSTTASFKYKCKVKIVETGPGATGVQYWNNSTSGWVGSEVYNEVDINNDEKNIWQQTTYTIDSIPGSWAAADFEIYLTEPYTSVSSGLDAIYYDNIRLTFINPDDSSYYPDFNNYNFIRERSDALVLSGVSKSENLNADLDNWFSGNITGSYYRSRDAVNFLKSISEITSIQVMNDYRDYLIRYEGTLYNNDTDPIGLHNKIWVDFGSSVLQEPVSCYLDSMTYNLKKNTYEVIMHIPNQNDDISSTIKRRFS
tara:strand:- start:3578 stop:5566 length:1989 start_codon:yes stop_codon:yes gene_type:complete